MNMKALAGSRYLPLLYVLAGACIGALATAGLFMLSFSTPSAGVYGLRQSALNASSTYSFIDPLLAVRGFDPVQSASYASLQQSIQALLQKKISSGSLTAGSVYFSDFNSVGGFVLDPTEQYAPASLLKVPLMMVYYKLAETDPSILQKQIYYAGGTDANAGETFRSPIELTAGRTYSVDDLIEHMIDYSDNNAAQLLTDNLTTTGKSGAVNKLFQDLGISQVDIGSDFLTVRAYSIFFRVLYNATYLDRTYSEKALQLLAQTDFTKGISSGVSADVDVAQKFGEFTLQSGTGLVLGREFNTCGIVYYASHPYLLCIMTKGSDFAQLQSTISEVSEMVFQHVEKTYGAVRK